MSYDIHFKVKVEGIDEWIYVGNCEANTTWNVRKIIELSTGLPWLNCENNGFCKDIIPCIEKGYNELTYHPEIYKKYEAKNGWGTVEGTRDFFGKILKAWRDLKRYEENDLLDVVTFWIE